MRKSVCSECQRGGIEVRIGLLDPSEDTWDDDPSDYLLATHDFLGRHCPGSGRVAETIYLEE